MQNVAPTRRLNRRSRDFLAAAAVIFLGGAALAILGLSLHIIQLAVPSNPGFALYDAARKALILAGIGLSCAASLMALRAATWKTDSALARQLGAQLTAHFDRRFVFIRSIRKRGIGYVDAALVSRHGVLVLHISNRKGRYHNQSAQWLKSRRGRWRTLRWNPSRAVLRDAGKVSRYFQSRQLTGIPIYAAVVFMREPPQLQLSLHEPAVAVVHASQLPASLHSGYLARERLAAKTVQQIVDCLYH